MLWNRRLSYVKNFKSYKRLRRYSTIYKSEIKASETNISFTNGRTLSLTTGKYARLADGSCVATTGHTSVLATVVSKTKSSSNNFLPLVVDYRQKAAAAGRIPTNFLRRELGPTEREILTSRLIDRSLRPLFPNGYCFDTQIVCNMLAVDGVNSPEVSAINAASAALAVSDIPWNGPVGAVRIGQIDNEIVVNPTRKELQDSMLNLVVAAAKQNMVVMLEGNANVILQQDLMKAIKQGTKEAQFVVSAIEKLQKEFGKKKRDYEVTPLNEEAYESVKALSQMRIREILSDHTHDKMSRDNAVSEVRQLAVNQLRETIPEATIADCFSQYLRQTFRDMIFESDIRCDGRHLDDLRKISCQVGLYKPLHGSALFQRGQTQVLCTVAFDSPESALKMDSLSMLTSGIKEKNFFLHYEFPPYATGEVGRTGAAGRREAGHGALAEKGLLPVVPRDLDYTVRLTSEVMESNGSSSMASVCGGSLALMDAGVELSAPAAGVAVGLVTKTDPHSGQISDYRILTDLLGIEDYMGDMDFKVAGTKKGITALQADIKLAGLPLKVVMEAIQKATDAKSKIINIMNECLDKPFCNQKENMPVTDKINVETHKRGKLLGVGGSNLKRLYVETGVQLTPIDDTTYSIFAPSQTAMDEAQTMIAKWLEAERVPELEFGAVYKARVVEVKDMGVLVALYPGMSPALVHNTQLDHRKVHHPSALGLEVGSEMQLKYFGRDPVSGQLRLSRKVLIALPPNLVKNLDKSGSS